MNFFAEQDNARRNTKLLLLLFVLAVLTLIVITNMIVAVGFWVLEGQFTSYSNAASALMADSRKPVSQYFTWSMFGKLSLWVSGTIACVIAFKWLRLRGGGKNVAEALGGTRVNPNTNDADEKRILNVVEEMALASGMPVPPVYLLKGEKGINAFAAGHTPADAVIGITQGALDQFNREQLQGVVAHEFSHILNGDMRLNLRLIAMVSGIVFIANAGELIMRAGGGGYGRYGYRSSRRSGDMRVVLAGLALLVVGWLGSFFAGLIKSAINRQREFLADASAVQFTRNPQGIADALKIIGGYNSGSRVFSAGAAEMSHMFISNALGRLASFATHPPLEKRIARIEPQWNGQMIPREIKVVEPEQPAASRFQQNLEKEQHTKRQQQAAIAAAAGAAFVMNQKADSKPADASFSMSATVDAVRTNIEALPPVLTEQTRDAFGASALIYAMLLSTDEGVQKKQLDYIQNTKMPGLAMQTLQLLPEITALDKTFRLPLLELAVPALKCLSAEQYKVFKKTLLLLIRADNHYDMFEWCLFQLVRHYLAPEFEQEKPSRPVYKQAKAVAAAYTLVLSTLAYHSYSNADETERAFNRGANTVGLYAIRLLPKAQCQLDDFVKAVNQLANCYPLLKPKLLKGLADCARLDGEITVEEKEIIASVAAVMDCPGPDLISTL